MFAEILSLIASAASHTRISMKSARVQMRRRQQDCASMKAKQHVAKPRAANCQFRAPFVRSPCAIYDCRRHPKSGAQGRDLRNVGLEAAVPPPMHAVLATLLALRQNGSRPPSPRSRSGIWRRTARPPRR